MPFTPGCRAAKSDGCAKCVCIRKLTSTYPASLRHMTLRALRQGTCDQGVLCSFAHGEEELRRKGDPMPSIKYLRSLYTGAKIPDGEWCAAIAGLTLHGALHGEL